MSTPTIADVISMQNHLSKMIQQLVNSSQKPSKTIPITGDEITLHDGEEYAGIVLDEDGIPTHHLVLMAGEIEDVTWDKAMEWANAQGGELPTRQEQALLYANCKQHFQKAAYWSNQQSDSDSGWAWYQYFGLGDQYYHPKSYALRARAVRRLVIE